MQRDAPAVGGELRRLRRNTRRELAPIARLLLELLEASKLHGEVQVGGERRDVRGGRRTGVHVLVRGAIRNVQRRARLPVVARAINDAETGAVEDVHRLLTVHVPTRAPPQWDLRLEQGGALRRDSRGLTDEHR